MACLLNGFAIRLSADTFNVQARAVPDPGQMKALRAQFGHEWFLSWRGGYAYGIPKGDAVKAGFGRNRIADCRDHNYVHLISARLSSVLPQRFPKYKAFSRRPFAFLGQKEEIVGSVIREWNGVDDLVHEFKIRPRFELDPRIIELRPDQTEIAIFLKIGLNWSILAPLEKLQGAQIELAGLNVVRRDPGPDERRLVGTIASLQGGNVLLSESFDDLRSIEAKRVQLEGSKASFARCLRKLLGSRYQEFDDGRYRAEGEYLLGPSLHKFLKKMQDVLKGDEEIRLAPDLTREISDIIEAKNEPQYQTVVSCGNVQYCLDAAKVKRHELAWTGLTKFGPFDRETFPKRSPRILVVCPNQAAGKVSQFIRLFRDGIQSEQNSRFAKGFSGTFGLVNPQFVTCEVPTLGKSDGRAGETYWRTIENYLASTDAHYDLALVVILDQHSGLADLNSPYLRGKAVLLMNGIPVQDVRPSTITARPSSLQHSLQNLSVAIYAKMGGTPWTVSHDLTVDDEVVTSSEWGTSS